MEVEAAARRMVIADATVMGYVGTRDRVYRHRLGDAVSPAGNTALVLRRSNGWGQPESRNTQEFPVLVVECWADHSRNTAGEFDVADNTDRAYALYRAIDPLFHGKRGVVWGDLTVISSQRWHEPWHATNADEHGTVGLLVDSRTRLGAMGDAAVVVVSYAVQVVHAGASI